MNTNVNVVVKFFNDVKGFGFFTQKKGKDVFIHVTVLEECGFTKVDMVMGKPATIDFVEAPRGFTVTKIHKIGDKQAPPTERRAIVDRNADSSRVIVKVTDLKTGVSCYEIRVDSIDGHLLYVVDSLAKARQEIGRTIVHPISEGHGKRTNVPRQVVKKGDNGKSDKKAA